MTIIPETVASDYQVYRNDWLREVEEGKPSTVVLGNRFAQKLVSQWLDLDPDSDDIEYCDGANDGGIDVAVLVRPDALEDEEEAGGDTWYLVQSKYGSAFQGINTIFTESIKILDTLDGKRDKLSSLSSNLVQRLQNFREAMSDRDRLVVVLATVDPLTKEQRQSLDHVRVLGQATLGTGFDVEEVSIRIIFDRLIEGQSQQVQVPIAGDLVASGNDIRVGTVGLIPLYEFLKAYQTATGDLDQIYEKNVRRFLGGRGRVNKTMKATLDERPEQFGLFNNGITIVVTDYREENGKLVLTEPFIVNGCQTTKTIWESLRNRLESGGSGSSASFKEWKQRADQGAVVTKIVKVGSAGDDLLRDITRFTNSQNAVREKDFLAITSDFRTWSEQMAERHDVYLETQRGGWDSQRAHQKQKPNTREFTKHANAFDLLKVYGAAWLGEAGTAYGSNKSFLPNGTIFKRVINDTTNTCSFGVEDLYAAYLLSVEGDKIGFGRAASQQSRRQTRFLFYWAVGRLLRDAMIGMQGEATQNDVTQAIIKLWGEDHQAPRKALISSALQLIDDYMTRESGDEIYNEPELATMGSDVNRFLKWEKLGRDLQATPQLGGALALTKKMMSKSGEGSQIRDAIAA